MDASSILFGRMMMLSFRRGNAGEREGLGRTRERRGRGNEFHSKQEGNCILRKARRATEDNGNTTAHKL